MIARLRRLWRAQRLTVPTSYPSTPESRQIVAEVERRVAEAIRTAPCEPIRAPEDHVARARANRAAHYRALGEDPEADWGPFDESRVWWSRPEDAA